MKQLNLSESQLAELREIYRAKLSHAVAAVEEIRNVLRQLDSNSAATPSAAAVSTESDAPARRRGRKPGKKAAKKGTGRRGRPSTKAVATVGASSEAAPVAEEPKRRGRKPGFKPSKITKAGRPAKKRGRKPKNA